MGYTFGVISALGIVWLMLFGMRKRAYASTIGTVQGTEASTPSPPSLPSDTTTAYYIPLAYVSVLHPHTLTSVIGPSSIVDIATVLGVAPSAGGIDCRPLSAFSSITYGANYPRKDSFMPQCMFGKVERVFGFDFTDGKTPLALNGYTTLDDSIDWRNRLFKSTFYVSSRSDGTGSSRPTSVRRRRTCGSGTGTP